MTPNRMEAATGVDGARRSAWSAIQAFLLSETLVSVCYWSTVALVALAGACVLYWRWTRSAPVLTLPDDPWGVTTPPWVVEVSLPVLLFGYLAEVPAGASGESAVEIPDDGECPSRNRRPYPNARNSGDR
jgi:hypothetical protein